MIGDFRTDALREALGRAPIEDDMLMALLILAFAGQNVSVTRGAGSGNYGHGKLARHACPCCSMQEGKLAFDMDTLRVAARSMLIDVFSCRENAHQQRHRRPHRGRGDRRRKLSAEHGYARTSSCACRAPRLKPRARTRRSFRARGVKDTRAALVEHFKEGHFVPFRSALRSGQGRRVVVAGDESSQRCHERR